MYARGDVDGALAVWQEALALAPGDSRAMGYVDYVVSNYQVLRKPTVVSHGSVDRSYVSAHILSLMRDPPRPF